MCLQRFVWAIPLLVLVHSVGCIQQPKADHWDNALLAIAQDDLRLIGDLHRSRDGAVVVTPVHFESTFVGLWDSNIRSAMQDRDKQLLESLWTNRSTGAAETHYVVPAQSFQNLIQMYKRAQTNQSREQIPLDPAVEVGRLLDTDLAETLSLRGFHSYDAANAITKYTYQIERRLFDVRTGREIITSRVPVDGRQNIDPALRDALPFLRRLHEDPADANAIAALRSLATVHRTNRHIQYACGFAATESRSVELLDELATNIQAMDDSDPEGLLLRACASAVTGDVERTQVAVEEFVQHSVSFSARRRIAECLIAAAQSFPDRRERFDAIAQRLKASESVAAELLTSNERLQRALAGVVHVETSRARGTGFILANGLVVTAHHVVFGETRVSIRFADGIETAGSVVAENPSADVAVVAVVTGGREPLQCAHPSDIRAGSNVLAVGFPLEGEPTLTRGIVSAVRRVEDVELIQTDAAINPGNSGGPLLLDDGSVVGMNAWKYSNREGVGFAVSTSEIQSLVSAARAKTGEK